MQSSMLGESNRRNTMEIFRELDNGEVLMHMLDDIHSVMAMVEFNHCCLRGFVRSPGPDMSMIERWLKHVETIRLENTRQIDMQNDGLAWQWHL